MTDFDWFFPEKKYKLDLNKTMYSPSSSDRPQVGWQKRENVRQSEMERERERERDKERQSKREIER